LLTPGAARRKLRDLAGSIKVAASSWRWQNRAVFVGETRRCSVRFGKAVGKSPELLACLAMKSASTGRLESAVGGMVVAARDLNVREI
jgi:hypothetical protein